MEGADKETGENRLGKTCNAVGQLLGKEIYGHLGGHNFSKEILNEHTHTRVGLSSLVTNGWG